VIVATGAHERPVVFADNDRPGIMLAAAARTFLHRYGVLAGRDAVVFTTNDSAYEAAKAISELMQKSTATRQKPRNFVPEDLLQSAVDSLVEFRIMVRNTFELDTADSVGD